VDEFELKAFSCTAEFSSLSKAALFLRVSQPAVSRSIRNLEESLNTTLLIRHGRGVALTTDGERFLQHAKGIIDNMERAKRDLIALRAEPQGTVKFGMPTSVGSVLLPKLARGFKAHYPGVTLVGIEAGSVELFEWLLDGRLDVAVIHEPSPSKSLVIEEVLLQRLYFVGRPARDLADKEELSIEEVTRFPLVLPMSGRAPRIRLEQAASAIGRTLDCVIEVNSAQLMRSLALEGLGYTILPYPYVSQDVSEGRLVAIKIDDRLLTERLCIVTTTFNPISAATRVVARTVRQEFPSTATVA
jgi:LysR family transcriptional regulator, nitrogen assimilation regulatory protein